MTEKILLYKKDELGLFLFKDETRVQFVVAYLADEDVPIGTNVEYWHSGTYHYNLEDALEDIKSRKV